MIKWIKKCTRESVSEHVVSDVTTGGIVAWERDQQRDRYFSTPFSTSLHFSAGGSVLLPEHAITAHLLIWDDNRALRASKAKKAHGVRRRGGLTGADALYFVVLDQCSIRKGRRADMVSARSQKEAASISD